MSRPWYLPYSRNEWITKEGAAAILNTTPIMIESWIFQNDSVDYRDEDGETYVLKTQLPEATQ